MRSNSLILALLCVASSAAFECQLRPRRWQPATPESRTALARLTAIKPTGDAKSARKTPTPAKKINLTHERDFFRQQTRLESMDSYVLVSTLTSSMSFGALLGFTPSKASMAALPIQGGTAKFFHSSVCLAIQVVAGLSTLCGLYSTIIFSLTILYGKSALGAERDVEYDDFLRTTVRARVNGFRNFTYSLGLFVLMALLVLVERTSFRHCFLPVVCLGCYILHKLYKDWELLFKSAETIYRD